jgi:SAM-dependent methyltransferase
MSLTARTSEPGVARADAGGLACPACGAHAAEAVVELTDVPVMCGVLWPTRSEAVDAEQGDLRLVACQRCSMLRNAAFDPSLVEYEGDYDNSLHFSPTFQRYADGLARHLVDSYEVRGGTVLEIGSGKGDFLRQLCALGGSRGWGYDPAYAGEQGEVGEDVTFVAEYFAGHLPAVPDLVCARHVLEHMAEPAPLLDRLRKAAGPGTVLYVEVPDTGYILGPAGLWDLIYPHVGYFTAPALRHLAERCGFEPLDVRTAFGGQYLCVEARATEAGGPPDEAPPADEVSEVLAAARGFAARHRTTVRAWDERLRRAQADGERMALWGAGTKAVTFLNVVPAAAHVAEVVDLNPRKHGRFVPGTGQEVVGPERLAETRPDLVLVMNPMYEAEIRIALADLGLHPTVTVV